MLRIKYPQFLNCFKYISPTDISIAETIETLSYGTQDSKHLAYVLEKSGNDYQKLIETITKQYYLPNKEYLPEDNGSKIKKKAIKDIMVENYLIKMKREKGLSIAQIKNILQWINLRLFLKILPLKNILVENGEIVEIIDPVIETIIK